MAHPDLLAHRAQFEKSITRLGDGIYTAVGYYREVGVLK